MLNLNLKVTEGCCAVVYFYCQRDRDYRWGAHNAFLLLATANMLNNFGYSGLKMILFFIKHEEDTTTCNTWFSIPSHPVSSLLSLTI